MSARFDLPRPGDATPVRFPSIVRTALDNGLDVWTLPEDTVPAAVATLLIPHGTGDDPAARPGLASLTGDLLDEGAGARDAIALGDAFARMGAHLDIDVGPDSTSISVVALSRFLAPCLDLVADIVARPRLTDADFARVRELRLAKLRQTSQSAAARADRAFVAAVFGAHPYGHGALGTTASLSAMAPDEAREFWSTHFGPQGATLIVGGDVRKDDVLRAATLAFASWPHVARGLPEQAAAPTPVESAVLLVDRPGAPQSELRIGHAGPPRSTKAYHALIVVNALLGGQFTSRINRLLREEKAVTYGARTAFDFRRVAGTFTCETSVQADATATALADVLREFDDIRQEGRVSAEELERAKASLTRGYVRQFETPAHLVRAASQLALFGLPDDTFDRFVPGVQAVGASDIARRARAFVRPDEAVVVVVGDAAACGPALEKIGRPVRVVSPEF